MRHPTLPHGEKCEQYLMVAVLMRKPKKTFFLCIRSGYLSNIADKEQKRKQPPKPIIAPEKLDATGDAMRCFLFTNENNGLT
jgi:hypothetical protein